MQLIKISSLVLALTLIFTSCQDDPTSLGKDLVGGELQILEINSQTDSLQQSSSNYLADSLSFGSSTKVLLGNLDYLKSTMLLRYGTILADSIRTSLDSSNLTVLSAEVELRPSYRIGDLNQQLNFSVHEITSDWGATGFNSDSLSMLTYDPIECTDSKNISDSLITFNVNESIALRWLNSMAGDTLVNNYGMLFLPDVGSNLVYGFKAYTGIIYEDSPLLRFVVQNEDNKIDTINTYVVFDTHVPEGTVPAVEDGKFQLTGGLGQRAKLFFDLSSMPVDVNINKAELTLYVDSLSSLIGSPDADSLRIHFLDDSTTNEIDDDESIQRIRFDGEEFNGTITRFVQAIVSRKDNHGFSLSLSNEIEAVDRYVIYGSNYSDLSLRPKLVIYYNLPK